MDKRFGSQSVVFHHPPRIVSFASVVGPKEGEGPLGRFFDEVMQDDMCGEKSFEKAERTMYRYTVEMALKKANINEDAIDMLLGGDLLNQIITASFAARDLRIPFIGLYGACSTMAESLIVGSMMVDGGFAKRVVAATSSHFSAAERQYRAPLELGNQRSPTAQRTVTGAGAVVLSSGQGRGCRVTCGTLGRVIDFGIKDATNMGAAMAPAVADTIATHLMDFGRRPEDYDAIITGDLGKVGRQLLLELLYEKGFRIEKQLFDCGCEIFSENQDVDAGGSGCGCSASVLCGYLLKQMDVRFQRVLFVACGALLSVTSSQQGESIPAIAHAVVLEA